MQKDTFWSDTMNVLLSNSMDSSIEGPQTVIENLAAHLSSRGYRISRIRESHPGTKQIHPRSEMFLNCGADSALVAQVEEFLTTREVRFTKHQSVNTPDHIDLSYELNNVSVWKSKT